MTDLTSPSITAVRDLREATYGPIGGPAVTSDLSEKSFSPAWMTCTTGRAEQPRPLLYGTACCFIEFAALLIAVRFRPLRSVPCSSPRQADLLIVAGTVTMKMAPPWCGSASRRSNRST